MGTKKVSIIILNYNGLPWLQKCIPTIRKQTYKLIEIVVTDNNSTDGSREWLQKNHPDIIICANKDNYGYAKANNLGAQKATGEYLFFLNNDTELRPQTIENLVKSWKPNAVVTGRQLRSWEKEDEGSSGAGMDIFGYPYVDDDPKKTRVFYPDGAMIFVAKADFEAIGGFDDELFIFQEDIDFGWRAQMMGYTITSCWDGKLIHYGGATVTGTIIAGTYESSYFRRYLNEKNILRNILKNYEPLRIVWILPILISIHAVEIVALFCLGQRKAASCYIKAYIWNIRNLKNTLTYRKNVQQKRKISDKVLMKRMYWRYSKLRSFMKLGLPKFS